MGCGGLCRKEGGRARRRGKGCLLERGQRETGRCMRRLKVRFKRRMHRPAAYGPLPACARGVVAFHGEDFQPGVLIHAEGQGEESVRRAVQLLPFAPAVVWRRLRAMQQDVVVGAADDVLRPSGPVAALISLRRGQ